MIRSTFLGSLTMEYEVFNKLALASVLYSCGRATYMPSIIVRILKDNVNYLSKDTIDSIQEAIRYHDRNNSIGWDIDRDLWIKFSLFLNSHRNNSPTDTIALSIQDSDLLGLFILSAFRYDSKSDKPVLAANDYMSIIDTYKDIISSKSAMLFMQEIKESFGPSLYLVNGPRLDPIGYVSLYDYIYDLYKDTHNGEEPGIGLIVPELTERNDSNYELIC